MLIIVYLVKLVYPNPYKLEHDVELNKIEFSLT